MGLRPTIYCLNVRYALYRIIPFQPFNIVVKLAKFYCFYINQQAFNENGADFYEDHNVHVSNAKELKFRKRYLYLIENFNQISVIVN